MKQVLFILLLCLTGSSLLAQSWTFKGEKNGIKGYFRTVGKVAEIKFVSKVNAPVSAFVGLLKDVNNQPKWMTGVSSAKPLAGNKTPDELYYQCIAPFPWPMDNRDLVMYANVIQEPKTKHVCIKARCKPTYIPEKKDHIRLKSYETDLNLTPNTDGSTSFECIIRIGQADGIPTWVVDWFVGEKFFKSMHNLATMVKQEPYKSYKDPTIKE
ncbi:MAG: START domain-containing protein [Bacteroidia bacterium]